MKIKKVGIIGAGNMGSGIAQKIAQAYINVVLVDVNEQYIQKGLNNIKNTLSEAVKRKIFSEEQIQHILNHISGTTDQKDVSDADLVIEAIFEDFNVKKELFNTLDKICEDKTILASNTSSYSITELASQINRPDRFIGLHFFYHPAKNRLLEIIPGQETSDHTIAIATQFSDIIGKTAIHVQDAAGFAVNRFFVPWLNEATRILEEDLANIPTIDDIAKKAFRIPMGPFELMNVTGIPIAYHSTVGLEEKLGEFYKPSNRLKHQFEQQQPWDLTGDIDESKTQIVTDRLLGAVFTVVCLLAEEQVSSIEDIDRGAKIGLRWQKGPFELMNQKGIESSYQIVKTFTDTYSTLIMPTNLFKQYKKKENWHFQLVDLTIHNNIAHILINRPEAMNAINEEVMHQLDEQFTIANSNPAVEAIILEGAGKAFVAGADIQYFIKKIKEHKIDDIYQFTKYSQSVLNKIDKSEKQVIAKLDGLALGGGAEIALAADTIVATENGSIGFPETGIGIYPGLGGTQRTTRYIGKELAKYLVFTGIILDAKTAASIGLVEYLVPSDEITNTITTLIKKGSLLKKTTKPKSTLPDHFQKIQSYFADKNINSLLNGKPTVNELGQKIAKTISYKAPRAIELANKIIDEGSQLELQQGLELELKHLSEIFSTQDALEGLQSVVMRKRPSYTGK